GERPARAPPGVPSAHRTRRSEAAPAGRPRRPPEATRRPWRRSPTPGPSMETLVPAHTGLIGCIAMGGVEVRAPVPAGCEGIVSAEALDFVADLQRKFGGRREELLAARSARQERLLGGELPAFLEETTGVREDDSWRVAEAPPDLLDRRVEI